MSVRIVVHDNGTSRCETFDCDAAVVEKKMKYFASVIAEQRARSATLSISVNCDIEIFRWLVAHINGGSPIISVDNVVSLVLSSDFLGLNDLSEEALRFLGNNFADVVMSDVNLDHISDVMLEKVAMGLSYGKLCTNLSSVQMKTFGGDTGDLKAGPNIVTQCPNRGFVTKLLYQCVPTMIRRWCSRENAHACHRCIACERYFTLGDKTICLCSKGTMDQRGHVNSYHLPHQHCLCESELPKFEAALEGTSAISLYAKSLQSLRRKEESLVRSFFTPAEALSIVFLANHAPSKGTGTVWENRRNDVIQSQEISEIDHATTSRLLNKGLQSRCEKIQLQESVTQSVKDSDSAFQIPTAWEEVDCDWLFDSCISQKESVSDDPEASADTTVNQLIDMISLQESTVYFPKFDFITRAQFKGRVVK